MVWRKQRSSWGWHRVPAGATTEKMNPNSLENKNIVDDQPAECSFNDSGSVDACKEMVATSSPKIPQFDSDIKPVDLILKKENLPMKAKITSNKMSAWNNPGIGEEVLRKYTSGNFDDNFDLENFIGDTYDDYHQKSLSDSGLGNTANNTPDDKFFDKSPFVELSSKNHPNPEIKLELPVADEDEAASPFFNKDNVPSPDVKPVLPIAKQDKPCTPSSRKDNMSNTSNNSPSVNNDCQKEIIPRSPITGNSIVSDEKLLTSTPCSVLRRDDSITGVLKRKIDQILDFNIEDLENRVPPNKKIKSSDSDNDDDQNSPNQSREPLRDFDNSSMDETDNDESFLNNDEMSALFNADSENEEPAMINAAQLFQSMHEPIDFDVNSLKNSTSDFRKKKLGEKAQETYRVEQALTNECIEKLHTDLQQIPEEICDVDPVGLRDNCKLMLHQKHALKWMKWRETKKPVGGILADDMGLGKTLEMISLVLSAKNERKEKELADGTADESYDDLSCYFPDLDDCATPPKICEGRTLVVCPPSLLEQWKREIWNKVERGKLKVLVYHGPTRTKNLDERRMAKYDIVLTTYHIVANERDLSAAPKKNKDSRLFRIHWERVVLDEAHFIRNRNSRFCLGVCELRTRARWALTGTPIQNGENDFYALLKFLECKPFNDWKIWRGWVSNNNTLGRRRLVIIAKSIMLRRTKVELMDRGIMERLPDKIYEEVYVKLDYAESIVYQKMLLYSASFFEEFLRQKLENEFFKKQGYRPRRKSLMTKEVPDKISKVLKVLMRTHDNQVNYNYILVLILRLRQMCCHPALIKSMLDKLEIDPAQANGLDLEPRPIRLEDAMLAELDKLLTDDEDDDDFDEQKAKNVMSKNNDVFRDSRQSSKVKEILKLVDMILDKGEKMIIVSQWTGFLQVIANNLKDVAGAHYEIFSGKTPQKSRQEIVDRLNDKNDETLNILLLSLTAGGVGLNLMGANNILLIDLHWNPQWETQAQDRIYRLGQRQEIHVYKFICRDTIEEKIKALQDGKLQIADAILTGNVGNRLSLEDLKTLFSLKKDLLEENRENQDVEIPVAQENN